jgi:hypothetical protein
MREATYLKTARPQESEARTRQRTTTVMRQASYPEIFDAFLADHSVKHARTHPRTYQTVESMREASYPFQDEQKLARTLSNIRGGGGGGGEQESMSFFGARYKFPTSIDFCVCLGEHV